MSRRGWILIGLAMAFGLVPEAMIAHSLLSSSGLPRSLFKRDFGDFWSAGWLIGHGGTATIFHPAQFQAWLHHRFRFVHGIKLWSYPPSMGLLTAPLGLFPPLAAWCVWLAGGTAAVVIALRSVFGGWHLGLLTMLIIATPIYWDNLLVGQNALYMGALIILGFGLMDRRPVWSGIAFGLLTMKPQLGLLVPVALVAAGAWRGIAAAAITALGLAAFTAWMMPGSWQMFFAYVVPAMNAHLLHPYLPTPSQAYMASAFITAEGLRLPQAIAWGIQCCVSVTAAVLMWLLWRRPAMGRAARRYRMLASAALGLAATPYSLDYDAAGATALLCAVLIEDGATIGKWRLGLMMVALAQPGWSLILGVGFHWPVFSWIAWLLLGCTLGPSLGRQGTSGRSLTNSLAKLRLEPVRAGAGGLHVERQPVGDRRERA